MVSLDFTKYIKGFFKIRPLRIKAFQVIAREGMASIYYQEINR